MAGWTEPQNVVCCHRSFGDNVRVLRYDNLVAAHFARSGRFNVGEFLSKFCCHSTLANPESSTTEAMLVPTTEIESWSLRQTIPANYTWRHTLPSGLRCSCRNIRGLVPPNYGRKPPTLSDNGTAAADCDYHQGPAAMPTSPQLRFRFSRIHRPICRPRQAAPRRRLLRYAASGVVPRLAGPA